jgi:hypothetical protein
VREPSLCRRTSAKDDGLGLDVSLAAISSGCPSRPKKDGLLREGQKYVLLLDLLRKAPNTDTLWYWIAQWLKDEGVAAPHEVLPKDVFVRITKEGRERLKRFSFTDILYANIVGAWLPYSEALENQDAIHARFGLKNRSLNAAVRWAIKIGF